MLKDWRRKGVVAFSITLFFSSLWCFGLIMEVCSLSLTTRIFWGKVGFPSYTFGPLAWAIMMLGITDQTRWTSWKRICVLSIIPIMTVFFVWTNDFHDLIWHYSFNADGTYNKEYGIWFWVHAVYSDGLNIFSVSSAIYFWRNKAPLYGRHFSYLAYSMLFVMFTNLLYLLKWTMLDLTPVAWGMASIFITRALFHHKLFELVPIARNRIIESMVDNIVVLDIKNRIVDMNPAARRIFTNAARNDIGCQAAEFFEKWPNLYQFISENREYAEVQFPVGGEERYFEAACLPIKNEQENMLGKLITFRDVTEKKLTEQKLLQKQQEIAVKDEREQMAWDLHDNLGQVLGFINVKTQAAKTLLKQGQISPAVTYIEHVTEVAQEAHQDIRKIILTMSGQNAGKETKLADLVNELKRRAISIQKRYGIAVEIDADSTIHYEAVHTGAIDHLANIIKEALNNGIKHAETKYIKIEFTQQGANLSVDITDQGKGFGADNADQRSGVHGLLFMKQRMSEIGGSLKIHSELGQGTTITLQVPGKEEPINENTLS